jgi:gas vesicle protein
MKISEMRLAATKKQFPSEETLVDNGMARKLGISFLAGAIVGMAIGLLYAPQSGRETRIMIADTVDKVKEIVSEAAGMVEGKVDTISLLTHRFIGTDKN